MYVSKNLYAFKVTFSLTRSQKPMCFIPIILPMINIRKGKITGGYQESHAQAGFLLGETNKDNYVDPATMSSLGQYLKQCLGQELKSYWMQALLSLFVCLFIKFLGFCDFYIIEQVRDLLHIRSIHWLISGTSQGCSVHWVAAQGGCLAAEGYCSSGSVCSSEIGWA